MLSESTNRTEFLTGPRAVKPGIIGPTAFVRTVKSVTGSMKIGPNQKAVDNMKKTQAFYDLLRLAEELSPRAQYILHPNKDDLTPYLSTNQEVELYDSLLLKAEIAHLFGKKPVNPEA